VCGRESDRQIASNKPNTGGAKYKHFLLGFPIGIFLCGIEHVDARFECSFDDLLCARDCSGYLELNDEGAG